MRIKLLAASLLAVATFGNAPLASAATTVVTVRPSNTEGWAFNSDPRNTTPYSFTTEESSIGDGSIEVAPIGTNAADKFTAGRVLNIPAEQISSFSYDFQIAGNGDSADANQFYLNVLTNAPGSTSFFDCSYDYVPTSGSTSEFTTATFETTSTPTNVRQGGSSPITCPATLSELPAGSTVKAIVLNVGDTSSDDAGIGGFIDNVVVTTLSDTTAYDFEADLTAPANKEACKNGGWDTFTIREFKNQGDCVSFVASGDKAKGNPANKPTF